MSSDEELIRQLMSGGLPDLGSKNVAEMISRQAMTAALESPHQITVIHRAAVGLGDAPQGGGIVIMLGCEDGHRIDVPLTPDTEQMILQTLQARDEHRRGNHG